MILIEFFGLPGSGKTTILKSAAARLINHGDKCFYPNLQELILRDEDLVTDSNCKIALYKLIPCALSVRNQIRVFSLVKLFWECKTSKQYKRDMFNFFKISYLYMLYIDFIRMKRFQGIIMSDNGLAQISVSVQKRTQFIPDRFYERYFNIMFNEKVVTIFIYLNISPELCCQRIYSRNKQISIMKNGFEGTMDCLVSENNLFKQIYEVINSKTTVIQIDSEREIEDCSNVITGYVKKFNYEK